MMSPALMKFTPFKTSETTSKRNRPKSDKKRYQKHYKICLPKIRLLIRFITFRTRGSDADVKGTMSKSITKDNLNPPMTSCELFLLEMQSCDIWVSFAIKLSRRWYEVYALLSTSLRGFPNQIPILFDSSLKFTMIFIGPKSLSYQGRESQKKNNLTVQIEGEGGTSPKMILTFFPKKINMSLAI